MLSCCESSALRNALCAWDSSLTWEATSSTPQRSNHWCLKSTGLRHVKPCRVSILPVSASFKHQNRNHYVQSNKSGSCQDTGPCWKLRGQELFQALLQSGGLPRTEPPTTSVLLPYSYIGMNNPRSNKDYVVSWESLSDQFRCLSSSYNILGQIRVARDGFGVYSP